MPCGPCDQCLTHSRRVIGIAEQDLGRRVGQGAAAREQLAAGHKDVAEAEVGELDHAGLAEEDDVLGLEVAVDDAQAVAVGEGADDLLEVGLCNN